MSTIPSRSDWSFLTKNSIAKHFNIDHITNFYIKKLLRITQSIFEYRNLPDTIPQKDLELILQTSGSATILEVDGKLYAFSAGLGGPPNPYYLPTLSVVANPALPKANGSYKIDDECVVVLNDSLYEGLLPLISHNAYLLAQCDVSFKFSTINSRINTIITAVNDTSKKDADEFLRKIEVGDSLGVIADIPILDNIKFYNSNDNSNVVKSLIELRQYILGSLYQDLGINSTFNMKREAINEAEAGMNDDILYPTLDDMLEQRRIGIDKINSKYSTKIEIDFNSVWKRLRQHEELELEEKQKIIEELDGDIDE